MVHHVVWWTLQDGVNGKTAKEAGEYLVKLAMEKMSGKIDALLSLEITTDFAKTTTEDVQLLLHSTHKDEQALAEYAGHSIHVAFGTELKKYAASRRALDFIV